MAKPSGPPFTVPRHGSLGESIIAERDWLKEENERLKGNLSLAEEGLANYQQEIERLKADVSQAYDLRDAAEGRYCSALEENGRLQAMLNRIQQKRLDWAMLCDHDCPACTELDDAIRGDVQPT